MSMKGACFMAAKPSKKPATQQSNTVNAASKHAKNTTVPTIPPTPDGYWRAPVYGLQWPTPEHSSGAMVSGVLADLDSCNRVDDPTGLPLPAIVLVVDEPTRAIDPQTGELVTTPSRGAIRIVDPGFMKFSRLLGQPGKVPHLFVYLLRTNAGPRFVVDVSTHPHDASAYGLTDPPPDASGAPS
jgi:hypothetical protein